MFSLEFVESTNRRAGGCLGASLLPDWEALTGKLPLFICKIHEKLLKEVLVLEVKNGENWRHIGSNNFTIGVIVSATVQDKDHHRRRNWKNISSSFCQSMHSLLSATHSQRNPSYSCNKKISCYTDTLVTWHQPVHAVSLLACESVCS